MADTSLSNTRFREYFAEILSKANYRVLLWNLVSDMEILVLAENPYYIIAFQVFDIWADLFNGYGKIELALSQLISEQKGTAKTWDAYLVLACRTEPRETKEFNQFSNLVYNTLYTRKIICTGLGNSLMLLDKVTMPFLSLKNVMSSAKGRDPLRILGDKIAKTGYLDIKSMDKFITIFNEQGDLTGV